MKRLVQIYKRYFSNQYGNQVKRKQQDIILQRANGVYVYDNHNNRYVDCISHNGTTNQGHCHPQIQQQLKNQIENLTLSSRAFYNDQLGESQKYLNQVFGYDKALLMNTENECIESAIKVVRRWGYDVKGIEDNEAILLFSSKNTLGSTLGAMASSDLPFNTKYGPIDGFNFQFYEFNKVEDIQQLIKQQNLAGIFLSTVLIGNDGVQFADQSYIKQIRQLCDEHNVLMVIDEQFSGLGRTGKLLDVEYYGVRPDVLCIGGSITGGYYPVSAVLCDDSIMMNIKPGDHGSTYGGNPLGTSLIKPALQVIDQQLNNVHQVGQHLLDQLTMLQSPFIRRVFGRGLLIIIEFEGLSIQQITQFVNEMANQGVLVEDQQSNYIKIIPALSITPEQVQVIVSAVQNSLNII